MQKCEWGLNPFSFFYFFPSIFLVLPSLILKVGSLKFNQWGSAVSFLRGVWNGAPAKIKCDAGCHVFKA